MSALWVSLCSLLAAGGLGAALWAAWRYAVQRGRDLERAAYDGASSDLWRDIVAHDRASHVETEAMVRAIDDEARVAVERAREDPTRDAARAVLDRPRIVIPDDDGMDSL